MESSSRQSARELPSSALQSAGGVLSDTFHQIKVAGDLSSRESWALLKVATKEYMALKMEARPVSSRASEDQEMVYSMLSSVAGVRIMRPTAAVAFLRLLGLAGQGFDTRFSRLTSRRRHEAHPDAPFLEE